MSVETTALRRFGVEVTPALFRKLALASVASLYVIVVTGATVRLTASGLGCDSWPGCQEGAFFPERDYHGFIEFGNRVFGIVPITLTALTWLAARRLSGEPPWLRIAALAAFLGTIAQAPLGLLVIYLELHPLLVMAHFLLALAVLGIAVVIALHAFACRGRVGSQGASDVIPRELRLAGLALVAACGVLVTTGAIATAAGPHSGDDEGITRIGRLDQAVFVHAGTTAIFGCTFLLVLGYLAAHRARLHRVFRAFLGLLALLLLQIAVGETQWRTELPWGVVLVHVSLAAAVWASTVAAVSLLWLPSLRSRTLT